MELILQAIIDANKLENCGLVLVGFRGVKGDNQRGKYDDLLCWDSPSLTASYQANTDPSNFRAGSGTGANKGMAMLQPGLWKYKKGMHKGLYWAFRQAAPVKIWRDSKEGHYECILNETINIHSGGKWGGTSSAGCQTLPAGDWEAFKKQGYAELDRLKQPWFYYLLLDYAEIMKGNYHAAQTDFDPRISTPFSLMPNI